MTARLVFLVVIAGALAVFFATRTTGDLQGEVLSTGPRPVTAMIRDQSIGGEEPTEPAEFEIEIQVDRASGKNRLLLLITEVHGYYADSLEAVVWNTTVEDDAQLSYDNPVTHFINKFVPANETLVDCIEIVPAELAHVGGDIGESADWEGEVLKYGRARVANPHPLPVVVGTSTCD